MLAPPSIARRPRWPRRRRPWRTPWMLCSERSQNTTGRRLPNWTKTTSRERRRRIRQSRTTLDELGRVEDRSRDLRAQIGDGAGTRRSAGPQAGRSRLLAGVAGRGGRGAAGGRPLAGGGHHFWSRRNPRCRRRRADHGGGLLVRVEPLRRPTHGRRPRRHESCKTNQRGG